MVPTMESTSVAMHPAGRPYSWRWLRNNARSASSVSGSRVSSGSFCSAAVETSGRCRETPSDRGGNGAFSEWLIHQKWVLIILNKFLMGFHQV